MTCTDQATNYLSILLSSDARQGSGSDFIYCRPPSFDLLSRPNQHSVPLCSDRRNQAIPIKAYFATAAITALLFLLDRHKLFDTILCILFFLPYPFRVCHLAILGPLVSSSPALTKIAAIFVFVSFHWISRLQSKGPRCERLIRDPLLALAYSYDDYLKHVSRLGIYLETKILLDHLSIQEKNITILALRTAIEHRHPSHIISTAQRIIKVSHNHASLFQRGRCCGRCFPSRT